ncbi:MAG: galactokinase family protein [Coriobacteriia bacterium]|nr:galactokinase family protein [Coriobacteriia bacterium]
MILAGEIDDTLKCLYGTDEAGTGAYRDRIKGAIAGFAREFGDAGDIIVVSAPGRTEIGGNHTDHQKGNVLAGSVNLDVVGCARPNGTDTVRIISENYSREEVDLRELTPRPEEINNTPALVRGIAAAISARGFEVGGFDAYMTSNVPVGSGLSSSAAFEIAVGTIANRLFCGDELDAVEIAKIGQYAENVYFGKPCGLLDQVAASVGGVVGVDFANPEEPAVTKVDFDMDASGLALCIIDTGGDHKELTGVYAAIPDEMGSIAEQFGKSVLSEVPEEEFMERLAELRETCGDRAVLRAMHFFGENRRALQEMQAINEGRFDDFLKLVNASGNSSAKYLQNVWAGIHLDRQEIVVALALAEKLLEGQGAVRVHGGGFAGTIQAFVPKEMLEGFKAGIEKVFGEDTCHVLKIRPAGGVVILS